MLLDPIIYPLKKLLAKMLYIYFYHSVKGQFIQHYSQVKLNQGKEMAKALTAQTGDVKPRIAALAPSAT